MSESFQWVAKLAPILNMARVRGDTHIRKAQKGLIREACNLHAIAVLSVHFLNDAPQCGTHALFLGPAEGVLGYYSGHIKERPASLGNRRRKADPVEVCHRSPTLGKRARLQEHPRRQDRAHVY